MIPQSERSRDLAAAEAVDAHRLDERAVARWLGGKLPGFAGTDEAALRAVPLRGGQSNPTFVLEANGRRWVLRKKPPGKLLPSAHLIEREHRVLAALGASGSAVPVPRVFVLCEDASVVGTPFFVMEHVDGRVLRDPSLPGATPEERRAIYDAMDRVLAALHRVDWRGAGLSDFGRPDGYLSRQIARWTKQYESSMTRPIEVMDWLARWLAEHVPNDAAAALTHGDFRIDNLIFGSTAPEVLALLDWELATIGHPIADLAYACLVYYLPRDAPIQGLAGAPLRELGIPSEEERVEAYCRLTSRGRIDGWPFYLAFSLFRLAAITQGIRARVEQGNASGDEARAVGEMTEMLACAAREVARRGDA